MPFGRDTKSRRARSNAGLWMLRPVRSEAGAGAQRTGVAPPGRRRRARARVPERLDQTENVTPLTRRSWASTTNYEWPSQTKNIQGQEAAIVIYSLTTSTHVDIEWVVSFGGAGAKAHCSMANTSILTMVIGASQFPFVVVSRIAEHFNLWEVRAEADRCLKVVDSFDDIIPKTFTVVLVAAEDHRNAKHAGVDPIAMIRAIYVRIRWKRIEGASTIEQQFVRTVSGCYERSLRRKLREQMIAIAVCRKRRKVQIARAYLSIAFYGSGCTGIEGLSKRCGGDLQNAERHTILGMIARLKYPEPLFPTTFWRSKLSWRVRYIAARISLVDSSTDRIALAAEWSSKTG